MKKLVRIILKAVGILAIFVTLALILKWWDDRDLMKRCMEYHKDITEEEAIKYCKELMVEVFIYY